jgi:6-phosphogluconolactonase
MREFATPRDLAGALADYVADALRARIVMDGIAALAVSGGTTPVGFFKALSRKILPWAQVTITLVDDRWVDESSSRSNAQLVKSALLQNHAAAASFLPLVNDAPTPEDGLAQTNAALANLPLPFAAVVLGMGTDGHTASFFPNGDRLDDALAPTKGQMVETIRSDAAIEPRITLTLPVLLAASHVALHIEGLTKRDVLLAAQAPGFTTQMPVRAVLARNPPPDIFWSP